MNQTFNMDCMEYMKTLPDKYFDLAVVDPPYGGGADVDAFERDEKGAHFVGRGRSKKYALIGGGANWENKERSRFGGTFDKYKIGDNNICAERTGGTWAHKYGKNVRHWDVAPPQEYFDELARVSKNQIIWGGNYFALPPTRCFLIWKKLTISETFSMAMAEYAWTSFNDNAKVFEAAPQGKDRFHPTQKPVALYDWIFRLYAKQSYKILDTHLGSGSSRIAAYKAGLDFVGLEVDKTYYDLEEKRFAEFTSQRSMFDNEKEVSFVQGDMFNE